MTTSIRPIFLYFQKFAYRIGILGHEVCGYVGYVIGYDYMGTLGVWLYAYSEYVVIWVYDVGVWLYRYAMGV